MPPARLSATSLAGAARELASRDRDLAFILKRFGPPPLWARRPGFPTLVRIILEQQVSLASAASIFRKLKSNVVPFQPEQMVQMGDAYLRSLGLTRQKSAYCLDLAESMIDRRLSLPRLGRLSDEEARAVLMEVKGIGPWSADIYLLMALGRADIWPASDLALAIAITKLKQMETRPNSNQLLEMAQAWRPFRSVAARMLWQYYLARTPASSGK